MHMVGLGLSFASVGMFVSLAVDIAVAGPDHWPLLVAALATAAVGVLCWRSSRVPADVRPSAAFAAASATWIVVSVFGALPYVLAGTFDTLDSALFESVSGFTATGSTVLDPIEGTGRGLLFWRQLTQWYGGMGMILLAVAVLPIFGVGGQELLGAEGPGPTSEELAPRISQTARRLWLIYLGLTGVVVVGLLVAGLNLYDSVTHALTAVSTGGFSPYNDSIAHFDSVAVEAVLMVGMFLGATSFIILWRVSVGRDLRAPWRNPEFRYFVWVVVLAVAVVTAINIDSGQGAAEALRVSSFNVVSLVSSTGFGTANFVLWAAAAQMILLALMVTGGMSGSTSGAMKLFRVKVMAQFSRREVQRARRTRTLVPIRFGDDVVDEPVVGRIAGFVLLYFLIVAAGGVLVIILGSDIVTGLSGSVTSMGGVGPALGDAGPTSNFLVFPRPARGVLMVIMLLGRLEVFPMMLMFAAIWHRMRPGRVLPSRA